MRVRSLLFALIAASTVLSLGTKASAAETTHADSEEMGRLFEVACLTAFPDNAALDAFASKMLALPMTRQQVRNYLHSDPGRGWYVRSALAQYAITIESPPYSACAVRRMTPDGMSSVKTYLGAVSDYVKSKNATTVAMPPQQAKTADGADVLGVSQAILAPDGASASELFMVFITNYHGHYQGELKGDEGGPGVEIRFVHQIPSRTGS